MVILYFIASGRLVQNMVTFYQQMCDARVGCLQISNSFLFQARGQIAVMQVISPLLQQPRQGSRTSNSIYSSMTAIPRDKREKRIASLMEMGVTRAAAKAALRAKGWQTEEVRTIATTV